MVLHATAQPPARTHTSITLSLGTLAIPLSVYTGTQTTRVERKEFLGGDCTISVGRAPIIRRPDGTPEVVEHDEVTRMAQATSGAWVTLTDDEIADCTSPRGLAEIQTFVPLKDLGQYLIENVVQVRPKRTKGKVDIAGERAFNVLVAALAKRKVAALVKVALRGPARFGLLTPEGNLLLVYTADAVREALPLSDGKPAAREVDLGVALIDAIGIDTPVLSDDTAPVVQEYVDRKAKGVPAPAKPAAPAINGDLMEALEASIAARKGKVA